jgi:hypothetical protein
MTEREEGKVRYYTPGSLPPCEVNKKLLDLQNMIIGPNKGDFIPGLSPNYNPNTGRLEINDRHVGMIDIHSANKGRIATKWIIKD